MKLKPTQLRSHLKRHGLAPIYLLMGDEPFQIMECADTLRTVAHQHGFTERVILTVVTGFDWNQVTQFANTWSLFANHQLLEVQLGNKLPGTEGARVLTNYASNPPSHTLLLITAEKLDANQQKTKWFTSLDKQGVIIPVWPLAGAQLTTWITQRMSQYHLQADSDVINIIAERCEGHLLAAAQEIEKLSLLYGAGTIDTNQVLEAVADSARFELFTWVDTVLRGEVSHCIRQLSGLRAEGVEAVLVTWVLNREIRRLCQITYALYYERLPQQSVFKTYGIWSNRQEAFLRAIKRYPQPHTWQKFLIQAVQIEQIVKGVMSGNSWDELQQLSLQIAGKRLLSWSEVI